MRNKETSEWDERDSGEVLGHELNNPLTGILGNAELLLVELRNMELPQLAQTRLAGGAHARDGAAPERGVGSASGRIGARIGVPAQLSANSFPVRMIGEADRNERWRFSHSA
jgi:signal transduction histidine kinase